MAAARLGRFDSLAQPVDAVMGNGEGAVAERNQNARLGVQHLDHFRAVEPEHGIAVGDALAHFGDQDRIAGMVALGAV
ncbi:hypothetical protein LP420_30870 [Massilia sp. B-10]|nr:hypothetical protein LP420_30870 [Massilia sp. B-10]